jgi:hypothetical protein
MQRVTRSSAVGAMPAPPASPGAPGWFTQGNPGSGIPATVPGYEWFNGVQAELIELITRSGVTPDAAVLTQLRQSLDRLHGGGLLSVASNVPLSADNAGLVLVDATAAARTITLPAANAAGGRPIRLRFVRTDASANVVTIQRTGTDVFGGGGVSVTIPRAGSLILSADGVGTWHILGEAARGRSIGTNGWTTLPGGLILQWGQATMVSITQPIGGYSGLPAITLPLAFPTACLNANAVTFTPGSTNLESYEIRLNVEAVSSTQLQLAALRLAGSNASSDMVSVLWQAIGW